MRLDPTKAKAIATLLIKQRDLAEFGDASAKKTLNAMTSMLRALHIAYFVDDFWAMFIGGHVFSCADLRREAR